MRWTDCCAAKGAGGLGIIDHDEALTALMGKWILKALVPGTPPLHILLRHRLVSLQPRRLGAWPKSLHWALLAKFTAPKGSRLWNRMVQA